MRTLREDQAQAIRKAIDVPGGDRVVILEVPIGAPRIEVDRNLYRLGPDGCVRWQVSVAPGMYEGDPFVSLNWSGEMIRSDRFFGAEYHVDPASGFAEEIGWHK
jgi:hypothetical protein